MDFDRLYAALARPWWLDASIQLCISSLPDITRQTTRLAMSLSQDQFPVPSFIKTALLRSYPSQRSLDLNASLQTGSVWSGSLLESLFPGFAPMTVGASSTMLPVPTPFHGVARLPGRFVMTLWISMPHWACLEKDHMDFVLPGLGVYLLFLPRVWTSFSVWTFALRLSVFCLLYRSFVCLIVVVCCPVPLSLLLVKTSVI